MFFQEIEPHLTIFADSVVGLLGNSKIGVVNTVYFIIVNFIFFVCHYHFLTNFYSYNQAALMYFKIVCGFLISTVKLAFV